MLEGVGARQFYWARFIRIYPTFLLALILALWWASGTSLSQFVAEALMIHAWLPGMACSINCPDWSISNEAFFYALFPVLLPLAQSWSTRRLIAVAVAVWALSLVPAIWLAHQEALYGGANLAGLFAFVVYFPLFNLSEFVMGLIAGVCFIRHPDWFARHNRAMFRTMLGGSIGLAAWIMLDKPASDALFRLGLLSPLFVVMIASLATSRGRLASFLGHPFIVLLGNASYAVYLYQTTASIALTPIFARFVGGTVGAGLAAAGLIGLSIISYQFFERPIRASLRDGRYRLSVDWLIPLRPRIGDFDGMRRWLRRPGNRL